MKKMLCIVPIIVFVNALSVVVFLFGTTQAKEVIHRYTVIQPDASSRLRITFHTVTTITLIFYIV